MLQEGDWNIIKFGSQILTNIIPEKVERLSTASSTVKMVGKKEVHGSNIRKFKSLLKQS